MASKRTNKLYPSLKDNSENDDSSSSDDDDVDGVKDIEDEEDYGAHIPESKVYRTRGRRPSGSSGRVCESHEEDYLSNVVRQRPSSRSRLNADDLKRRPVHSDAHRRQFDEPLSDSFICDYFAAIFKSLKESFLNLNGLILALAISVAVYSFWQMGLFAFFTKLFAKSEFRVDLPSPWQNFIARGDAKLLQKDYPGQSKEFWSIVQAAVKHLLVSVPANPAVLLLLHDASALRSANRFAERLAVAVESAFANSSRTVVASASLRQAMPQPPLLDCAFLATRQASASATKQWIDEKLIEHFATEGGHVAAVLNLEKLLPQSAMIFHSYCDGENPSFKESMLIFTVSIQLGASDSANPSHWDILARNRLSELWEPTLGPDKTGALLSRVLSFVAYFKAS